MLSDRTAIDGPLNALTAARQARQRRGLPIFDLTVSNPTAAGLLAPESARDALRRAAETWHYAPDPLGSLAARQAIAAAWGHGAAADQMVLTASTSEAYAWILQILCNPGEAVLAPEPCYPLIADLARLAGVRVVHYPVHFANGRWVIDLAELALRFTAEVRAVVAISPANPTGQLLSAAELQALERLCADRHAALVVDEVFADSAGVFGPLAADLPATAVGDRACLTLAMRGLSKTCLLPQCKLAWTAVCGPAEQVAAAMARFELLGDTFLSVASAVQAAVPALLASVAPIQAALGERLRANRRVLHAAVTDSPLTLLHADGGWSAVLRLPATCDDEAMALAALQQAGVVVQPGCWYDFPGGQFIVISLLVAPEAFASAVAAALQVWRQMWSEP